MICAYHSQNPANVQCNACGKALCPSCDHRIKGFPYCQDCIVEGVDRLRQNNRSEYAPFVRRKTIPVIALFLSFILPGLGAAYNGQTVKALVYFGVFVGLFQMAVLTGGTPLFVLAFFGMWAFAALDAWRTAQMIRNGITPDVAEDVLVRRFSGNPKLWGVSLTILGSAILLQNVFDFRGIMRGVVPAMLIGLGVYILRGYVFPEKNDEDKWTDFDTAKPAPLFMTAKSGRGFDSAAGRRYPEESSRGRSGWRDGR